MSNPANIYFNYLANLLVLVYFTLTNKNVHLNYALHICIIACYSAIIALILLASRNVCGE